MYSLQFRTHGELSFPVFPILHMNLNFYHCPHCIYIYLRARNDDLVERMNGKMKKTEDNVETVSSKIKLLEGEQEKITSTIGGGKIYFFPGIYPV